MPSEGDSAVIRRYEEHYLWGDGPGGRCGTCDEPWPCRTARESAVALGLIARRPDVPAHRATGVVRRNK